MKYKNDLMFIKHILDSINAIEEFSKKMSKKEFLSNRLKQSAIVREIEIIGEAIRKLTEIDSSLKISGSKQIIGLRNMIVHAYDSIDPATLWRILIKDIPILKEEIKQLKK